VIILCHVKQEFGLDFGNTHAQISGWGRQCLLQSMSDSCHCLISYRTFDAGSQPHPRPEYAFQRCAVPISATVLLHRRSMELEHKLFNIHDISDLLRNISYADSYLVLL
jgi:hypothetical protein